MTVLHRPVPADTARRRPSPLLVVLAGLFVLQLGWIAAVPPFGGIDEFDHSYRASSVAHGEWVSEPEAATRGTGAVVSVSRDIVLGARPECQALLYTGPEDCIGVPRGDRVEIASGAGRYNPAYYVLVGYPTSWLDGAWALYAMRIISALGFTLLVGAALRALHGWASAKVLAAVGAGLTPVLLYSSSVVAPNGLEAAAGLALWAALASLANDPDPAHERAHLVLAAVAACLLVSLRSLGPLWALLIVLTSLVAWPELLRRLLGLLRSRAGVVAVLLTALVSLSSVAWILLQKSLVIGIEEDPDPVSLGFRLARSAQEVPLWILQSIAAFPNRSEPAPMAVYPAYLIVLAFLLVVGLRHSSLHVRRALVVTVVVSLVVPFAITAATLTQFGTSWQGRYTLPYLLGASLLAGLGWARSRRPVGARLTVPALVLLAGPHILGPVAVAVVERNDSPVTGTALWPLEQPTWVVGLLVTVGSLLFYGLLLRGVQQEGRA